MQDPSSLGDESKITAEREVGLQRIKTLSNGNARRCCTCSGAAMHPKHCPHLAVLVEEQQYLASEP